MATNSRNQKKQAQSADKSGFVVMFVALLLVVAAALFYNFQRNNVAAPLPAPPAKSIAPPVNNAPHNNAPVQNVPPQNSIPSPNGSEPTNVDS